MFGEDGAGSGKDAFDVWAVVGFWLGCARDVDVIRRLGPDRGTMGGGGGAEEAGTGSSMTA